MDNNIIILLNTCKELGVKNIKVRVSCKEKSNDIIEDNRYTFILGILSNETIKEIITKLIDIEGYIDTLLNFNSNESNFIVSFSATSIKLYIDSEFKVDNIIVESLEIILSPKLIKHHTYYCREFLDNSFDEILSPDVLRNIKLLKKISSNSKEYVVREDGQHYFKLQNYKKFVIKRLFSNRVIKWIEEIKYPDFLDNYSDIIYSEGIKAKWIQFNHLSMTIYFSV